MTKYRTQALLATLLVPGVALAQINVGDELGASETSIRAALEARGFTNIEVDVEQGGIEVEATHSGGVLEIEIASDTGRVLSATDDNADDGDGADEGNDAD